MDCARKNRQLSDFYVLIKSLQQTWSSSPVWSHASQRRRSCSFTHLCLLPSWFPPHLIHEAFVPYLDLWGFCAIPYKISLFLLLCFLPIIPDSNRRFIFSLLVDEFYETEMFYIPSSGEWVLCNWYDNANRMTPVQKQWSRETVLHEHCSYRHKLQPNAGIINWYTNIKTYAIQWWGEVTVDHPRLS